MARKKKPKVWSYTTGERGRNRVRAYCEGCPTACRKAKTHTGALYLEWREGGKRLRALLRDVAESEEAKKRADELAARFAALAPAPRTAPVTLAALLDLYVREATPEKGDSKRRHDRAALRVWFAFFDAQEEVERRSTRHPSTLDRTDWERFAAWRRAGRIPGWSRPVRDRQVQYDLAFLLAALNWATGRREGGRPLLEANPWAGTIRRAQGWESPRELSPDRPGMPEHIRSLLIQHAPSWQFAAALELERETRRRNAAIRRLVWSDVDLAHGEVEWRAEVDKAGRGNRTPLTPRALEILRSLPRGIGAVPVFPSASDPAQPTTRDTMQTWLQRAKQRALRAVQDPEQREQLRREFRRVGFHAEKRSGVRDPGFRRLPPKIQEELAGTNYDTLRRVYDEVTVDEMRREMEGLVPGAQSANGQ